MQELSATNIAIAYLVIINVVTFFVYGIDKWRSTSGCLLPTGRKKAKHAKWRVSEATLLILAIICGSIGAWLGMKVWHHKTQHKKFRYGIPLIIILQVALLMLTSCGTKQNVTDLQPIGNEYVPEHTPNVFLVMYDAEVGKDHLMQAIKEYRVEVIYDYNIIRSTSGRLYPKGLKNGMALKKPDDKSLEEIMQNFKKVKGVLSVEYDHVYHLKDPVKPKLELQ